MILQINLDGNDIKLVLKDGRETIAESAWVGEYTLSEQLLPQIDALLKKNKIAKNEVEKVTTKISPTSGVTSSRIVQTVAKAWNAGTKA
jgi:tRNA A37 threonylcarbamoyladenosine modification protein TsaB